MKLFSKAGDEILANKDQVEIMIASGWSKTKPEAAVVKEVKEVKEEVKETAEVVAEVEKEAVPKILKKIRK